MVSTEPITVAVLGVRMFRTLLREFPDMTAQVLAGLAEDLRRARDELEAATRSATREPIDTRQLGPMEERERLVAESAMFGSLSPQARGLSSRTTSSREPPGRGAPHA